MCVISHDRYFLDRLVDRIVELDEGIRIMGQITDCEPEKLKIGDRLTTQFRRMSDEGKSGMIMYAYKFVPDLGVDQSRADSGCANPVSGILHSDRLSVINNSRFGGIVISYT